MVKPTRMFPLLALIVGVVLSVLPAEGQAQIISGKGTGIDPGNPKDTAAVTINGQGDFGVDLFTSCPLSATVLAVVNTSSALIGSDVFPFNDANVLPVLPLIESGSGKCIYQVVGPPRVYLALGDNPGPGTSFHFTLLYRQGKYVDPLDVPTCPTLLRPLPVQVELTTAFALAGVGGSFTDTVDWLSRGRGNPQDCDYLKFPA